MSAPTSVLQFDALPSCEFEHAGERCPSGRRSCKFSDIPCGLENPAGCSVSLKVKGDLKVKAEFMKAKKTVVKKRRRSRVEL